jgi:hypothetical protein
MSEELNFDSKMKVDITIVKAKDLKDLSSGKGGKTFLLIKKKLYFEYFK